MPAGRVGRMLTSYATEMHCCQIFLGSRRYFTKNLPLLVLISLPPHFTGGTLHNRNNSARRSNFRLVQNLSLSLLCNLYEDAQCSHTGYFYFLVMFGEWYNNVASNLFQKKCK